MPLFLSVPICTVTFSNADAPTETYIPEFARLSTLIFLQYRVEWYTQNLFAIFENGHYAADQVYFYDSNEKISANLDSRTRGKVLALRNHRDLNNVYFFLKTCRYLLFTSKNNRQKENLKYNIWKNCKAPKWAKLFSNKLSNTFCFRCNL